MHTSRTRRLTVALSALATALIISQSAFASGGNYVIQGGTASEQATVHQALNASSFNWGIVPQQISIVITPKPTSEATQGTIWLDPSLLDSGEFSWGVVQHEYAHEVDFFLLNDTERATIQADLGAQAWCWDTPGLQHNQYGCERFASTIAWAFWQNSQNCMSPAAISGESGGMNPAAFRALIVQMLGPNAQNAPIAAGTKNAPRKATLKLR